MGLFDFFKKKPAAEPVVEEQREGVVEIDGVEVETDVETEEISVEELEAEAEIEIEFVDEDGEELLTAENEEDAYIDPNDTTSEFVPVRNKNRDSNR